MHYRFYRQSLIMRSENSRHKRKYLNNLYRRFVKYQMVIIWQYLHMGKLVQVKLILCLEVIGRQLFRKIYNRKGKIHFSRIYQQMKILRGWFQERYINYLKKSKYTKKLNQSLGYIAPSCKFIMKKSMIYCKIFLNLKPWTYINLK